MGSKKCGVFSNIVSDIEEFLNVSLSQSLGKVRAIFCLKCERKLTQIVFSIYDNKVMVISMY